jgi:hypothetical protein
MNTARFWPRNLRFSHVRANQAQIVATFRFSATFTAHHYFFQFRICASLRKLGTSSRRHLKVFSLLLLLPFLSILHLFRFFTSSYMYFTFLLCFFLLFFFSPFVLFGFYTVYYIYACTLDYSTEILQRDFIPLRFHTSRALGALAFRCLSLCARRRNPHNLPPSPRSFLEPVSQPSRTLTPATALVCFVLGTASGVQAHHHAFYPTNHPVSQRLRKEQCHDCRRLPIGHDDDDAAR